MKPQKVLVVAINERWLNQENVLRWVGIQWGICIHIYMYLWYSTLCSWGLLANLGSSPSSLWGHDRRKSNQSNPLTKNMSEHVKRRISGIGWYHYEKPMSNHVKPLLSWFLIHNHYVEFIKNHQELKLVDTRPVGPESLLDDEDWFWMWVDSERFAYGPDPDS